MGWRKTCAVDERMRFVIVAESQDEPFAALCRQFGVSRRVGYKWLARYRQAGVEGLLDRSRAPHHHPQAIAQEIAERCLAMRRARPTWGPLKVRAFLERQAPSIDWPAASTIGVLFDREGLTVKRKLRRRSPPSSAPFAHCGAANDVWCIDFKGWFLTGDGSRCEPLTLTDAHRRYLLRCQALPRPDAGHVWPVLYAAFREFGLPHDLRSDNGAPFASRGAGGLSRLSVKLIKAGVMQERIAPGKPQQNGRHERRHLTLLQDTADPPARSLREQSRALALHVESRDRKGIAQIQRVGACQNRKSRATFLRTCSKRLRNFRRLYNEERPHQALGNATPAECYTPSSRRFDGILREPDYGRDHEVRRVRHNGEIKWQGQMIDISEALISEPVGLAEDATGFTVSFGPVVLGTIAHRGDRLRKPKRAGRGLVDDAARCPQGPQPEQQQHQI